MIFFADTSFLCALYREQDNSPLADAFISRHKEVPTVSSLSLWEFRQSVRLQVFLYNQDRKKGYPKKEADRLLSALEQNLKANGLMLAPVDWSDVHHRAELISSACTSAGGHRAMDILHVATALHLGATHFLTFDGNQNKLALAAGLKVPL